MRLSLRPARAVALIVALAGLAACDSDSTGSGSNAGGTYNVVAGRIPVSETQTQRVTLPGVLYQGGATIGNVDYNIREELTGSSIILDGRDRSYSFVGTFRITEVNNRLAPETVTVEETGTYRVNGTSIVFAIDENSPDLSLDGDGTISDGVITVEVTDPFFDDDLQFEFRR